MFYSGTDVINFHRTYFSIIVLRRENFCRTKTDLQKVFKKLPSRCPLKLVALVRATTLGRNDNVIFCVG